MKLTPVLQVATAAANSPHSPSVGTTTTTTATTTTTTTAAAALANNAGNNAAKQSGHVELNKHLLLLESQQRLCQTQMTPDPLHVHAAKSDDENSGNGSVSSTPGQIWPWMTVVGE
ncbi:unnamed protein product [Protopolystoma xenopodis]|uniref:Uncharacterized protein n=1 Tax=Protopolystoma xenopodis TaxID=117903 RepID=A0A448WRM5_9PLAT|nr:unnamed protein product [Protopolystoma xenopodis]